MKITIRATEPADYEAIRETMSQPNAIRGTMQLPFPAAEMWRKRLAEPAENTHLLVAEADGKVVANLGLLRRETPHVGATLCLWASSCTTPITAKVWAPH